MQGINFKEHLLLKIPLGLKTQTRRLIFPKTDYTFWNIPSFEGLEKDPEDTFKIDKDGDMVCYKDGEPKFFKLNGTYALFEGDQFQFDCAYLRAKYQPEEILYLKEPYFIWEPEHCESMPKRFVYKYGLDKETEKYRKYEFEAGYTTYYWHNKLFMPEKYARYFIKITNIRVEKVLDISYKDAIAEGFKSISEFKKGWISINGKDSLEINPWVFVYDFTFINKPQ